MISIYKNVEGMSHLDLSNNTSENIEYMISQIVKKMKMANIDAMNADNINKDKYENLREIYEIVMKTDYFSPSEMQEIAEELGKLRNT